MAPHLAHAEPTQAAATWSTARPPALASQVFAVSVSAPEGPPRVLRPSGRRPAATLRSEGPRPAVAEFWQAKLTIGAPDDTFEREADDVAARVVSGAPIGGIGAAAPGIRRRCAACEEESEGHVMRKALDGGGSSPSSLRDDEGSTHVQRQASSPVAAPMMVAPIRTEGGIVGTRGGGASLPGAVRAPLEGRFGFDFSRVRIHADEGAADLARSLAAEAFTVGSDIYFNRGRFAPSTSAGLRLLAHELTHVVQQTGSGERGIRRAPMPRVQRTSMAGRHETSPNIRIHTAYRSAGALAAQLSSRAAAPLPAAVASHFSGRLGHDLSRIRIHDGDAAEAAAAALRARAFTVGPDIVLGRDLRPATGGPAGHILAHELVHAIQQGAAPPLPGHAGPLRASAAPYLARYPDELSPFGPPAAQGVTIFTFDEVSRKLRLGAPTPVVFPSTRPSYAPLPTSRPDYRFITPETSSDAELAAALERRPADAIGTLRGYVSQGVTLPASCPPLRPAEQLYSLLPCQRAPDAREHDELMDPERFAGRDFGMSPTDRKALGQIVEARRITAARVFMERFATQLMKASPDKADQALDAAWIAALKTPTVLGWLAPKSPLRPVLVKALVDRLKAQDLGSLRREAHQALSPLIVSRLRKDLGKLAAWDSARGLEAKGAKDMPQATRLIRAIVSDEVLRAALGEAIEGHYLEDRRSDERYERLRAAERLRINLAPSGWYRGRAEALVKRFKVDPKARAAAERGQLLDPRLREIVDYLEGGAAKADAELRTLYAESIALLRQVGVLDHLKIAVPGITDDFPSGPPAPTAAGKAAEDPVAFVLDAAERVLHIELKDTNLAGNLGTSSHASFTLEAAAPLFMPYNYGFSAKWIGSRPGHSPAIDVAPSKPSEEILAVAPPHWTHDGVVYDYAYTRFLGGSDFAAGKLTSIADQQFVTKLGMVACGTGSQPAIDKCLAASQPPRGSSPYDAYRGPALDAGDTVGAKHLHSPEVNAARARLSGIVKEPFFREHAWEELRGLKKIAEPNIGGTFVELGHLFQSPVTKQVIEILVTYTHPSRVATFNAGDPIRLGTPVANVGKTGNALDEHGHIYVRFRGPYDPTLTAAAVARLPRYLTNMLRFFKDARSTR